MREKWGCVLNLDLDAMKQKSTQSFWQSLTSIETRKETISIILPPPQKKKKKKTDRQSLIHSQTVIIWHILQLDPGRRDLSSHC